jgi:AbrB family looped-hinge helix DNA binding protein
MQKVRMSGKGQVVIPADIRRKLSLKKGEMVFVEEDKGVIKIKPKTKLRSLRGTWPELDIETITKEIIEDREHDAQIEKEREKQREMQETGRSLEYLQ